MIKNYTSKSLQTFNKIQSILASHKANQILFEYDDTGKIKGVAFSLKIGEKVIGFKLPARYYEVAQVMYGQAYNQLREDKRDQAYRTAWANVRDLIDAQLAFIDTGQAKIEELFLPYAVNREGKTYFEVISTQDYLLPSGDKNE